MFIVIDTESEPEVILGEFTRTDEDVVEYLEDETGLLNWAAADCVRVVAGCRPGGPGHPLAERRAS